MAWRELIEGICFSLRTDSLCICGADLFTSVLIVVAKASGRITQGQLFQKLVKRLFW